MKKWLVKFKEKLLQMDKRKRLIVAIIAGVILVAVIVIIIVSCNIVKSKGKQTDNLIRKSTDGTNTVYTASGNVDVGTKTMSLELDISEFAASEGFSMEGFMGGMSMPGMDSQSQDSSSGTRTLEVEEVYVESGEEVSAGDPVLKLTKDSVDSIRTLLTEDVSSAKTAYEEAVTTAKQSQQQAQADYELNQLYTNYAESTYEETINQLNEAVESSQESLDTAQESYDEAQQELEEKKALLETQQQVLDNASYSADGTDPDESLYWWIVAYETEREAKDLVSSLTEEIEELEDSVEEYAAAVEEAQRNLALAQRDLEEGQAEAELTKQQQLYQAENAQEIYDVTTGQGSFNEEQAKADYENAQEKLEEFDRVIVDQVISAESAGVITEVYVEAGDTLTQNTELISVNSYEEVTITLSVDEDDLEYTSLGSQAEVVVAALPDQIFVGEVTEIGDAEIDSNTNKTTYTIIVTVQNPESLLYQDMTAEVTFRGEEGES